MKYKKEYNEKRLETLTTIENLKEFQLIEWQTELYEKQLRIVYTLVSNSVY